MTRVVGDFIGNYVDGSGSRGGAIFNASSKTINIVSKNITGNVAKGSSTAQGGAIYNAGIMGISAEEGDLKFYNNKTIKESTVDYNDIYNTGTINLNAATDRSIVFGGSVLGSSGTLNLNNDAYVKGGSYVFNNTVSGNKINLYNGGTIKLGSIEQADGTTTYGTVTLNNFTNDSAGGVMDSQNVHNDYINLGAVTLNSDLSLKLDADLINPVTEQGITHYTDTYYASSFSGSGKFIIDK